MNYIKDIEIIENASLNKINTYKIPLNHNKKY